MKRYVGRSQKDAISLARQAQLDLIGDALDASDDGFAIWKSVRAPDNSIENFTVLLMNKTGADAAEIPQTEVVGKTLKEIAPGEGATGLHALFTKALLLGRSVKEVVPGRSMEGLPVACLLYTSDAADE